MKTKFRKRILGITIVCLLALTISGIGKNEIIPTVSAKKDSKKEETCTPCSKSGFSINVALDSDESTKQNASVYKVTTDKGAFQLTEYFKEGSYDSANKYYPSSNDLKAAAAGWIKVYHYVQKEEKTKGADGKEVTNIVTVAEDTTTIKGGEVMYVKLIEDNNENVVLSFSQIEDVAANGCSLKCKDSQTHTMQVSLTMNDVTKKVFAEKLKKNARYSDVCKILRADNEADARKIAKTDANSFKSILESKDSTIESLINKMFPKTKGEDNKTILDETRRKNIVDYYSANITYCFDTDKDGNPKDVARVYKKKTALKQIKRVINDAYKKTKQDAFTGVSLDPSYAFDQAFIASKYRAGGKVDLDGKNNEAACVKDEDLKDGQTSHCYNANKSAFSNVKNLKCDSNSTEDSRIKDETTNKTVYNFSNLKSYYAYYKEPVTVQYKIFPTGSDDDYECKKNGGTEKGDACTERMENYGSPKTVCTRVCEEAVDVEYGPPVASKAGICFEYRVKVTSRIKCTADINPDGGPNPNIRLTTPVPYCTHIAQHGSGGFAGPNDDYETCIKGCDGGQYTQKCSKQCYNQVYANGTNNLNANYNLNASQMFKFSDIQGTTWVGVNSKYGAWNDDPDKKPYTDPHYIVNSGSITYYGGFARWYKEKRQTQIENNFGKVGAYGYFLNEGAARKIWSSNGSSDSMCSATCDYVGGESRMYNEQDIDYTIDYNEDLYDKKLEECAVLENCSTKTAEFTMSTEYNNTTVTYDKSTVTPPNNSDNCKESNTPSLKACQSTTSTSTDTCASKGVLYDYDGCYRTICNPDSNKYKDGDKFYQSEITYPGTWINSKTQEISFIDRPGWYKENEKFCLPLNTQDTNKSWWIWYMNQKSKGKNYSYSSSEASQADGKCSTESAAAKTASTYKDYKSDSDSIKYNIHATIRTFGHFGWNFNVDCFYATNESGGPETTNNSDNDSDKNSNTCKSEVKTRSVDLTDLFPNQGSKANKTRVPGFNWSKDATITTAKATTVNGTVNYAVDPEQLTKVIEQRGDKIFDKEYEADYLDYSFHLTPEVLKSIRQYNSNKKYTDYLGKFLDDAASIKQYGLIVYQSNLFRNGIPNGPVITSGVKFTGTVGCNNDYSGSGSSAGCEYLNHYNGYVE